MPTLADVTKWLDARRESAYPDALLLGETFPLLLLEIAKSQPDQSAFTVADNMVGGPPFDTESLLRSRCEIVPSSLGHADEEWQGFVDAWALYVSASGAATMGFAVTGGEFAAVLGASPATQRLSPEVRDRAMAFVLKHERWGAQNLGRDDLFDGRSFMDKVVVLCGAAGSTSPYQKGVRTAHHTMMLYVDLLTDSPVASSE